MTGTQPWPQVPVGNKDHTSAAVVIIGAGISGMCMAIDLIRRNKCHNFIIVEKSSGIGGTWNDNKYPGCCCDVWSTLYSYSFHQNPSWTRLYPSQEEILSYLHTVAHKYQLYKYIRFNTSVSAATWDSSASKWRVDVKVTGAKDAEFTPAYTIETDFLISAVGQLNQPYYPDIEGLENFKGKIMHSARWDWSYNFTGKKIGVIGNGATSSQIIPAILPSSQSLTVYQRTPNYIIPRLDAPVPAHTQFLHRWIPPLRWRTRALAMDYRESFHAAVFEPESAFADQIRAWNEQAMRAQLPGREALWAKLRPSYAPGCKRVVISDDYYPALADERTTLETGSIVRVAERGIEVEVEGEGGERETKRYEHDLIVLATGFKTVEFLSPIRITGVGGRTLEDMWKDGAEALYGVTVPWMPNFGMFYGPNTNLGHNSIILMIEAQSRYLSTLISTVLESRTAEIPRPLALSPRASVSKSYNEKLQAALATSSFADPNCASWYKNASGKVTNNWSGTVVEYQEMLSKVDWDDYEVWSGEEKAERASGVVFGGAGKRETRIGRVREETVVGSLGMVGVGVGVLSVLGVGAGLAMNRGMGMGMGMGKRGRVWFWV
ncbi:flavin-binding monooxygenase-like protein [Dendryphion nanum]|uniref:Flavin-binding monooxygenase-like protein n=1 Tax=Dendryphion nanum TaxID=256645 RepID=A0A9P9I8V9_9PLEO|nr:flavin-binding monooxygenase-like protein [Dendryphion nanum]